MHHAWLTHFPPHEPYIFANLQEGPCMNALHTMHNIINPRRVCAARVTVVVLCVCVCVCVQASHPLLTQLQDQVDIYTYGLSIVLAPELI